MNGYAGVPRLDELRARIVERYGSLHAFCKAHPELKRSSVYLVMSGRYPGRSENQTVRIEAALEGNIHTPSRAGIRPAHERGGHGGRTAGDTLQQLPSAGQEKLSGMPDTNKAGSRGAACPDVPEDVSGSEVI